MKGGREGEREGWGRGILKRAMNDVRPRAKIFLDRAAFVLRCSGRRN